MANRRAPKKWANHAAIESEVMSQLRSKTSRSMICCMGIMTATRPAARMGSTSTGRVKTLAPGDSAENISPVWSWARAHS